MIGMIKENKEPEITMDKLDIEILKLLSGNARMSFKQLSSAVGITSPAVKSRMEKMERDGIIRGYSLDLDTKSAGYMVTAFINIAVETSCKQEFDTFIQNVHKSGRISGKLSQCGGVLWNHRKLFCLTQGNFPKHHGSG